MQLPRVGGGSSRRKRIVAKENGAPLDWITGCGEEGGEERWGGVGVVRGGERGERGERGGGGRGGVPCLLFGEGGPLPPLLLAVLAHTPLNVKEKNLCYILHVVKNIYIYIYIKHRKQKTKT